MKFIRIGLFILFLLFVVPPVFASRSMTISVNKSSLFGDEEAVITASASGFTDGETIYIKGAFYQEGSTNYFGFTKKDSSWVKNGESTTDQRSVVIGSWDGALTVKSDFTDSGYNGEGDYKVKVGFYYFTSGGNLSSVNWSENNAPMTLNEPDPTPTTSPTPTPAPTSTPQPSATNTLTSTPKPTNTPTKKPTSTVTPKPTEKKTPTPTDMSGEGSASSESAAESGDILGAKDDSTATSSVTLERVPSKKVLIITLLFISIGSALLSLAFVLRKQFFS